MCRHEDHPFEIVATRISGKKYDCARDKEVLVLRIDNLDSLEPGLARRPSLVVSGIWNFDQRQSKL